MSTFEAHSVPAEKRAPRLWIVETLVVLGVLGFGYFAITLDTSRWTGAQPQPEPVHPLVELVR
ncbi:MAG TPA: hypothetical protein GYA10_00680 [Alphaproteobacteria bacterium]|nr:hypothetical protein [Alphaproteobacteria bacterium]